MAAPSPARQLLRFGTFELDLTAGELRRNGARVKLQDQPYRVLAALLEHPGDIVTRDELRDRLWAADTFVDFETGLNATIKKLRQALHDDADSPRFVETIPRRGYRFIAPLEVCRTAGTSHTEPQVDVERLQAEVAIRPERPPQRQRRIVLVAGGFLIVVALAVAVVLRTLQKAGKPGDAVLRINALAVLPLENLSSDKESDFYAEGMTDELITQLAKLSPLRVISRHPSCRTNASASRSTTLLAT